MPEAPSHPVASAALLGPALADAVASLRAKLADPTALVAVLTPSTVNGTLARRELGLATSFVRVEPRTPAEVEQGLAEAGLRRAGLEPEPPGWARLTLARVVAEARLPGGYERTLREPGWLAALSRALVSLEAARVSPGDLTALALPDGLAEHAEAVAALLAALAERRRLERVAGPTEVAHAALAAVRTNERVPAQAPHAVVVLGDVRLGTTTFEVLREWLATRPVVRLVPAELHSLAIEPQGLAAAAPHAEVRVLERRNPGVAMVRTPDPTREVAEAVREAQAAVLRGVPLDRIAIVLPDADESAALLDALSRAGLRATWQTGPTLAETSAARFALDMLRLAHTESTGSTLAAFWYDLLRRPELRLRDALARAVRGRGRWRRLVAKSGAVRGTAQLLAGLERLRVEALGTALAPSEPAVPAPSVTDVEALDDLRSAVEALAADARSLSDPRPVGHHARALKHLLTRWWSSSPERELVLRLLESWGRSTRGPAVGVLELAEALGEAFDSAEVLRGALADPAPRVLSPMQLLGAELDVVLVTGLTEGRFPARPREDPLLPDALVDALCRSGKSLPRSSDRVLAEARRFAAVRSAAVGRLWLSAPEVNLLDARPLLAGSLLLGLASEQAKRRVGPSELEKSLVRVGRRGRAWPDDPSSALGGLEHLLARLHGPEEAARRAALSAVVDHALARRLVALHHGEGRVRQGHVDASLAPYAGFVSPAVLPCPGLGSEPLTPRELAELLATPELFFERRVLRAWPAPRIARELDLHTKWGVGRVLREEERALAGHAPLRQAFDARVATDVQRSGTAEPEVAARAARAGARAIRAFEATAPPRDPIQALDGALVLPTDVPFRLRGGDARAASPERLAWVVPKVPGARSLAKQSAALLEALARSHAGRAPTSLEFRDFDGGRAVFDGAKVTEALSDTKAQLRDGFASAKAGYFGAEPPAPGELERWRQARAPESASPTGDDR
jgi:hypothetical protein